MGTVDHMYGQAFRETFVLGQAIDDGSRDILMADRQPLGNYAEATALYYTAFAHTLDSLHIQHSDLVAEARPSYDERVFQLIQALEYKPPFVRHDSDPEVSSTALRASLSEALRLAVERVTRVQLQAHSEESIVLAMQLSRRIAEISNSIMDYGLTEDSYELHRFIAVVSENVNDILQPDETEDMSDDRYWSTPALAPIPDSSLETVGLGDQTDIQEGGIDAAEEILLPETNWTADQLEHLRSVVNAVCKRVIIYDGDDVVYDGPYPHKPFESNPALTRAIMDKLGFTFDTLRELAQSSTDPRFIQLTLERQLRQWIDQVDERYQNANSDGGNFAAEIRTQAKVVILNATSSVQNASQTKNMMRIARKKSMDRYILDLNTRVKTLREAH